MAKGKRKKPGANGRGRRQVPNLNNPKSRVLQNPPKALDQSRGTCGITGLILGALAGGFVLLVESVLSPLLVYLVNIVALYVARYASAIIYGAAIQLYWKVHADDGHPDEYDFRARTIGTSTPGPPATAD